MVIRGPAASESMDPAGNGGIIDARISFHFAIANEDR